MFDFKQTEESLFSQVNLIRAMVEPRFTDLFNQVRVKDRNDALNQAVDVIDQVMDLLDDSIDLTQCDPGHGPGHIVADYANGLRLFSQLDIDPKATFIGFLGGVLHDLACSIIKRYQESSRLVRHAEMGGLLIQDTLQSATDLNTFEILLVAYSVMAHTHYLKPQTVGDKVIQPYVDLLPDGKPFYPVWCTRWVDRLDCNGPRFVGRHYLTLCEQHEDFTGKGFEILKFEDSMKPMTREEAGHPTMLSHVAMFAGSQNNQSPYGKWDFGRMTKLRDDYRESLDRIIDTVAFCRSTRPHNADKILDRWTDFLVYNVEPTELGKLAAVSLRPQFQKLPEGLSAGWAAGFDQTMIEYKVWAEDLIQDLSNLPDHWLLLTLPGTSDTLDIREIIFPHPDWAK